jgi:Undecaprenyl-phosphate galactose phosphotransferase WbaP
MQKVVIRMNESVSDTIPQVTQIQTGRWAPLPAGVVLFALDVTVLLCLAWVSHWVSMPELYFLPGVQSERSLAGGLLLVVVLKFFFGIYSPMWVTCTDRLRGSLQAPLVGVVSIGVPLIAVGATSSVHLEVLFAALYGFTATLAVEVLVIYGMMGISARWRTPVAVIGAGADSVKLIERLQRLPWLGMNPVCIVDNDKRLWDRRIAGVPVVGPVNLLFSPSTVTKGVKAVIVADPTRRGGVASALLNSNAVALERIYRLLGEGSAGELSANYHDRNGAVASMPDIRSPTAYFCVRRALDIAAAASMLVLAAPLMLIISLLIVVDSPGPVFFTQPRWGGKDRVFNLLKFRSMHVEAERQLESLLASDPTRRQEYETHHKLSDDPRITRIGRLLRKTSLDELPQFWNALMGDMSLIGPRAYMPRELPQVGDATEIIGLVRPGITGYWQVSGRHATTFQERVAMDVFYVQNVGPLIDFFILLRTGIILVKCQGE